MSEKPNGSVDHLLRRYHDVTDITTTSIYRPLSYGWAEPLGAILLRLGKETNPPSTPPQFLVRIGDCIQWSPVRIGACTDPDAQWEPYDLLSI